LIQGGAARRTAIIRLLFIAALPFPGWAGAQGPAVPRTAAVLYVSYEAPARPAFDVARLHRQCWDRLIAILEDFGSAAVSRTAIEPLVYRSRARTSLGISAGFLSEISDSLTAGRIVIADLAIYSDRLLLKGRSADTGTGELLGAGIEEERVSLDLLTRPDPDTLTWLNAFSAAGRRLLRPRTPRTADPDTSALFLLPLRMRGIDPATGSLIAHCLLCSLLETGRRLEDPGVTCMRLLDAGLDPATLDQRARPELVKARGRCRLVIVEACSYEALSSPAPPPLEAAEVSGALVPSTPAASIFVRLVDGQSGDLIFGSTAYLDPPSTGGLFGLVRNLPLVARIRPTTDRLVHAAIQKG
jgi:hypothetical protein